MPIYQCVFWQYQTIVFKATPMTQPHIFLPGLALSHCFASLTPLFFHPSNRHDQCHADTTRAVSWRGPLRRNTRKARRCTSMMLTCNVADCNVLQRCKKPCGAASHLVARKSPQSFPATKENPFTSTSNEFHRLHVQISPQHKTPHSGQGSGAWARFAEDLHEEDKNLLRRTIIAMLFGLLCGVLFSGARVA